MFISIRIAQIARIAFPAAILLAPTISFADPIVGKAAQQPNTEISAHTILGVSGTGSDLSAQPFVGGGDIEFRTRTKSHNLEVDGSVGSVGSGRVIGGLGLTYIAEPTNSASLIVQVRPV
ncbi:MAG: hypothetical protein AAB425_05655, partial [Bdellovibrionota bacterium]